MDVDDRAGQVSADHPGQKISVGESDYRGHQDENRHAGKEDPVCSEVMDLFVRYLATEASSLVLKTMATGGLYLGGGIPPKILPLLQNENWEKNFDNNGRMHDLSEKVPVYVVLNDKMALLGAAYYGAYNM